MLNKYFEYRSVAGKDIFIVDDHHKVLAPWSLIRRNLDDAPNLITIDHHTDTHEAFIGFACLQLKHFGDGVAELAKSKAREIDFQDDESLAWAIDHLRHDEHIDAATVSKVLHFAFCIQLSDSGGTQSIEQVAFSNDRQGRWWEPSLLKPPIRPMNYEIPSNRIFVIPHECAIDCQRMPHNDDCVIDHGNMIIESIYLNDQLKRASEMSICAGFADIEGRPYILDIDLDAFHSKKSIDPDDSSTFYRLIKNSLAISIATEAKCVETLKFKNEEINYESLLNKLMQHIEKANA